jgi:glutaredoxin-like YruB-family protein
MKVKVYSTPACPYCHMAKDFFKENKIEFEDIDVSQDHEAAQEMIEKSGQMGVPVIDIDGKVIIGFNVPAIKEALKLK